MQEQAGFLNQRNRSPAGVAIVAGLHGAAIAALILFPPSFIVHEMPVFPLIPITETPPPPPVEVKEAPPVARAERPVTRPETEVATQTTNETIFTRTGTDDPKPIDPPPLPKGEEIVPPTAPVLTDAVIDPRVPFQPDYPARMARQEIEGVVVVRVLIGADGRVKAVEQVSATDPAFFEATKRQALRAWRFRPATRDGVAVESWRTMRVKFEMQA
ncbi:MULTISPECIES: energy transducer TonB [Sphingomonas]|uniref:Energy transducer TonB n=1 Tax=Edaphosphingomonas fennica TaxID=114404 RepID=A0A2T4HZU8_9SPHN|nr:MULTISPECIES: energy transducer TonB [Sphingomonas]AGH49946.1 TonB family protein [Sphingomonas sp. MM-1]MDX3883192.1 energy transducer TonB [Sphingomonas sp.]PTD21993.1 energy transducer TonB [Sphingomonas fennica]